MNAEYAISIDPASRNAGVSVWHGITYLGSEALYSNQRTWSARAAEMRAALRIFVNHYIPSTELITCIVSELIPKIVEPSVQMITGALVADPRFNGNLARKQLISPSSWKSYARRHGCVDKEPKGVKALFQLDYQVPEWKLVKSDDVADSIMIYLTYCEKNNIK